MADPAKLSQLLKVIERIYRTAAQEYLFLTNEIVKDLIEMKSKCPQLVLPLSADLVKAQEQLARKLGITYLNESLSVAQVLQNSSSLTVATSLTPAPAQIPQQLFLPPQPALTHIKPQETASVKEDQQEKTLNKEEAISLLVNCHPKPFEVAEEVSKILGKILNSRLNPAEIANDPRVKSSYCFAIYISKLKSMGFIK